MVISEGITVRTFGLRQVVTAENCSNFSPIYPNRRFFQTHQICIMRAEGKYKLSVLVIAGNLR